MSNQKYNLLNDSQNIDFDFEKKILKSKIKVDKKNENMKMRNTIVLQYYLTYINLAFSIFSVYYYVS